MTQYAIQARHRQKVFRLLFSQGHYSQYRKEIKCVLVSDVLMSYVGETEKRINTLFEPPVGSDSCVTIIDEADALLSKRANHHHDWQTTRVAQFLVNIEMARKEKKCLIIAITNLVGKMDEAVIRSGRLGQPVRFSMPNEEARRSIFHIYLDPIREVLAKDIDFDRLVQMTDGMSGADIEEIVRIAKRKPIDLEIAKNEPALLTMEHLTESIAGFKAS